MSHVARAIVVVIASALVIACGGDPAPPGVPAIANDTPESAALSLLALAREPHEVDGEGSAGSVVDPRLLATDPGALFDALDALRGIERPRVVAAERLDDLDRWAIDLEGTLAGPGIASLSVQAEPADDGTWRVVWFAGPDGEWPRRRRPRGDGLATSEPPGSD